SLLKSMRGTVITNQRVNSLAQLQDADLVLADMTPRQLLTLAGGNLPDTYCRKLESYRYGPGVFKVDWALSGPIPWKASTCARAGPVHVGGTLEEIAASERHACLQAGAPSRGEFAVKPFVLLAQPSLFDPTRAPQGKHTAWGYCHVPNGSTQDMTS